mmetsp:Transcript_28313/g.52726  ORF Transcript_28313/g.52726 Transcript_28313/m.52726 type:complete len:343 (+) Transcript_28313:1923-2951(+)
MCFFKIKSVCMIAAALSLAACAAPVVNVKKEWTQSIFSYSFIPLYPMREDVFVGDIRIHRLDANRNFGLHSRPATRLPTLNSWLTSVEGRAPQYPETGAGPTVTNNQIRWKQTKGSGNIFETVNVTNRLRLMSLPGIEVTRISNAEASASGLLGLWKKVIGTNVTSEDTVVVSLTGLETMEIPDEIVAAAFRDEVTAILTNDDRLLALCVAGLSMGDPEFEETSISVITRVAYARGAEYRRKSDRRVSVQASVENTDPASPATANAKADTQTTKALTLNEVFDRPMAFGVDAIMINPRVFYAKLYKEKRVAERTLVEACKKEAVGFAVSPASPLLTGAQRRD